MLRKDLMDVGIFVHECWTKIFVDRFDNDVLVFSQFSKGCGL